MERKPFHYVKLVIPRVDLFFTCWSILAHLLCLLGVFYNTTFLAIFVCLSAEIVNFTINKEFHAAYNFFSHYVPLFVLLLGTPFVIDIRPIIILITLYLLYFKFDYKQVLANYERPSTTAYQQPFEINVLFT